MPVWGTPGVVKACHGGISLRGGGAKSIGQGRGQLVLRDSSTTVLSGHLGHRAVLLGRHGVIGGVWHYCRRLNGSVAQELLLLLVVGLECLRMLKHLNRNKS